MNASARRVAVMALIRGDEVLLSQRMPDAAWGANMWHIPGGSVEDGESMAEAAIREIHEETGVLVAIEDIKFQAAVIFNQTDASDYDMIFFSTTKWQGEPHITEPHACQDMRWTKLSELPDDFPPHARSVLRDISMPTYVYCLDGVVKDER